MTAVPLDRIVSDLCELVRIDSRNPGAGERAVADWLEQRLTPLRTARYEAAPGRPSLTGTLPGDATRGRLHLLAHMDTVPAAPGWTMDPLAAEVRDGAVWGLGSADMKAGIAVAVNVLTGLAREGIVPRTDLVLWLTADEETSQMSGVRDLVARGLFGPDDAAIALEPTGLRHRRAQLGVRWVRVDVTGRSVHAGRRHLGADANVALAELVLRLRDLVDELPHRDPVLGVPLVTAGVVSGGTAANVVSGQAHAVVDLRLVPPMSDREAVGLVRSAADWACGRVPGTRADVIPLGPERPPARAAADSGVVRALEHAHLAELGGPIATGGADGHEAYTDAAMLAALTGSDSCTVFGPGSSDLAHVADEHVPIGDLDAAYRVVRRVCLDWAAPTAAGPVAA